LARGTITGFKGVITPPPSTIRLNGKDATPYVKKYEYARSDGEEIGELSIVFVRTVESKVEALDVSDRLEVWRYRGGSSRKIFDGFITQIDRSPAELLVRAADKLVQLQWREVTNSYDYDIDPSAGVISEIFLDLVTTYGGLDADANTVQNSGSDNILQKFRCEHTSVFDRCKALAETLGWQFYYRADTDKVYFEVKGYSDNSITLTVGGNVFKNPKWKKDAKQLKNRVYLYGAVDEVETTELFSGDGSTTKFTLTKRPISVKVYVASTLKVGGKTGSTTGSFDYSVDDQNNQIVFEAGSVPPNGLNNVEVRYSYALPTPVSDENAESIDAYELHEYTETLTDTVTVADAETRIAELLKKYSTPFLSATLNVNLNDADLASLDAGHTVTVVDAVAGYNQEFTVTRIKFVYPQIVDEVTVGEEPNRLQDFVVNVAEQVKRLNEEQTKNQELLRQFIRFSEAFSTVKKTMKLYSRGVGETFIIGSVPNSTLDDKWTLEDVGDAPVLEYEANY